ncbi:transglycosylase SLT domain-containing protein [Agrobacterium vitis]|uniref:transglycosylase SLT domain-containing protein n=1 Tax=Agrobacterium vitis TaxID=373 RepID=UPI00307E9215
MANRLPQPVGYRPFRVQPILQEGVLPSPRDDGELERKVAAGLARMADEFGQQADRQAVAAGQKAGEADAKAGAPGASTVTGDAVAPAQSGTRIAVAPENIRGVISEAATRHGVDPNALMQIASVESGFDPNAKNPNSSAGGLFQFIDGTAKQYGLADRFDPAQAADAAARLAKDNSAALKSALGRDPTAGELYLAHQQGAQGAIKLLSNPSARAADVVGGEAVSLNGGADGMTAGEFAAKWTSKFGSGSYKSIPSASSVAPVSVTPAAPVKIEPGKAGTFRPMEGDTLYARAYNVAGEKTYIQQLELTLLQDQDAVYDKYKDDPAMLQKAYGELLQAHKQEHLFPEIEADYTAAYNKRAYGLVRQAQDAQQTRIKQQDRGDFLGRVGTLEDTKSRAMAGIDFKSDSAPARLADLQATIDDHYDTAVAKGVISAPDAERAKRASRGDMMVTFYTKQAQTLPADDIASMRKSMTADYSAGKLDGVDADSWDKIDAGMIAAERARRTQDEKADKDLTKRGEDFASRIARGMPVSPDEFARFQLDAATAPKGSEIVGSTLTRMKVSDAIRTLPIAEVEKRLPSLLGEKATADDRDFSRKLIESHRKELQTDPIGVAERFGILPPSAGLPIDGDADPSTVSGAFSERINQAEAVARHFGVQPKYFRPGEIDQIEKTVTTDPERGVSIAAGLVDAAGRNAPQVLRELGQDAPAVSGAGEIMALGGNVKAARDLLAGYGKTPDGKAYPDMKVTARVPQAQKIAGGALVFSPDQVNSLDAQAAAIARKRLYDAGIDPKTPDAKPIYERAFQEAAGASFAGSVQYGGFAGYDRGMFYREKQVLVPPTVRADRFGTVIEAISDADLGGVKAKNGRAWTAADFQKAMPVAVDGGYVFALGDPASSTPLFIAGEDGKPILLDLGNMDALKKRVPEAFK